MLVRSMAAAYEDRPPVYVLPLRYLQPGFDAPPLEIKLEQLDEADFVSYVDIVEPG